MRGMQMRDKKVNIVVMIDILIVIIVAYNIIESYFSDMGVFLKLALSVGCGIVFVILNMVKIIGRIIQLICAALWTFVVMELLPVEKMTQGSGVWQWIIGIVVFLVFLALHVVPFMKEDMEKEKRKPYTKKNYTIPEQTDIQDACYEQLHSECKMRLDRIMRYFTDMQELFETCRRKYSGLNEQCGEEFRKLDVYIENNRRMLNKVEVELSIGRTDMQSLEEIQNYYPMVETFIAQIRDFCTGFQRAEQEGTAYSCEKEGEKHADMDMFFAGCTDKESVTRRYRQLMKTFHPDNQNGDQEMTQMLQETYEKKISSFNRNT